MNSYVFSLKIEKNKCHFDADHHQWLIRAFSLVSEDKQPKCGLGASTAGEISCENKVRQDPHPLPMHVTTGN